MTKGPQLLASGTPPYPRGRYYLKLNVQDEFGDVGTTKIPYIIGKIFFHVCVCYDVIRAKAEFLGKMGC